MFGEGLADGCEDRKSMWQTLYKQIENTSPDNRQISVMLGFLSSCATHDPELCHSILDSLVEDELLSHWFPYFQTALKIDKRGIERLHKALDAETVNIYCFERLAWARHESIDDDNLAKLLQKMILKEDGIRIVIQILNMRFHKEKDKTTIYSQNLIKVSRNVLLRYAYEEESNRNDHVDYELAQIAAVSLCGQEGIQSAEELYQYLAKGFQEYQIYSFSYPRLLRQLAQVQPTIFLDAFYNDPHN